MQWGVKSSLPTPFALGWFQLGELASFLSLRFIVILFTMSASDTGCLVGSFHIFKWTTLTYSGDFVAFVTFTCKARVFTTTRTPTKAGCTTGNNRFSLGCSVDPPYDIRLVCNDIQVERMCQKRPNEHAEATRINLEEGRGKETVCDDSSSFQ